MGFDFDAWRTGYDAMSYADHVRTYSELWRLFPVQQHFDGHAMGMFLDQTTPERVLEVGGWNGELAAVMLATCPWITVWDNVEICREAVDAKICFDPRYHAVSSDRFLWDLEGPLEYDALVMSHSAEHMRWTELRSLLERVQLSRRLSRLSAADGRLRPRLEGLSRHPHPRGGLEHHRRGAAQPGDARDGAAYPRGALLAAVTYPRRLPKYPIPLNSLGEMICPGCGRHFWPRWKDHRRVSVYHAEHCRDRVQRRGGRLTREQLRHRLVTFGPLTSVAEAPHAQGANQSTGGTDMDAKLASEQVIVEAPHELHRQRQAHLAADSPEHRDVGGDPAHPRRRVSSSPRRWFFVACWYLFWGIWLIPYRLIRRGSRKNKRDALRHREMLDAVGRQVETHGFARGRPSGRLLRAMLASGKTRLSERIAR